MRFAFVLWIILLFFFLLFGFACNDDDTSSSDSSSSDLDDDDNDDAVNDDDEDSDDDDDVADDDDDSFTCNEEHPGWTVGLKWCKPGATEGYTLFAPLGSKSTYLIDIYGRLINSWESEYTPGNAAYLLEDGCLLRTCVLGFNGRERFYVPGAGGRVERHDWEGNLVWEFEYTGNQHHHHHDVEMLPNGNVLMISWEYKSVDDAIAAGRNPAKLMQGELWYLHLIEVKPVGTSDGNIVWQWHLWDHLVQDFDATKANFGDVAAHPELVDLNFTFSGISDWNHTNSVDYNPDLDQIVVSSRTFCELWVIDHSTTTAEAAGHSGGNSGKGGDLLYRWGNPRAYRAGDISDQQFFWQHDVHWIKEGLPGAGHFLLFNNGAFLTPRNYSSVDELISPVDEEGNYDWTVSPFLPESPAWSYVAATPQSFFSPTISGAERLSSGNTLICDGNQGAFFEVTPTGEVVWKYVNPVTRDGALRQGEPIPGALGSGATRNSVFRSPRYEPDFPGLAGRDLSPQGYIELPAE